jgi:hypothetical protein
MSWKSLLRKINKTASIVKDVEAVASGNPSKISRRVKNKAKAKLLTKSGFWKF